MGTSPYDSEQSEYAPQLSPYDPERAGDEQVQDYNKMHDKEDLLYAFANYMIARNNAPTGSQEFRRTHSKMNVIIKIVNGFIR